MIFRKNGHPGLGKVLLVRIVKNVLLCIHMETLENRRENRGGSSCKLAPKVYS